MKNRMFEEMLKAARVRLNGRDPKSISMNAKILFDEEKSLFLVNSFGSVINISYPDYIVKDEIAIRITYSVISIIKKKNFIITPYRKDILFHFQIGNKCLQNSKWSRTP